MNIIEYYNITDAYDDDRLPESLKLKYSTKENIQTTWTAK